MKKLLCSLLVVLCLSGCGSDKKDEPQKTTKCTMEQKSGDITFTTTQDITYAGDVVKSQKQTVSATLDKDDKDMRKKVEASIKANKEKYKDIKGMSYEAAIDKNDRYTEVITFDFSKISATDYGKATNQKIEGDQLEINYQQSISNLKKQKFTCN